MLEKMKQERDKQTPISSFSKLLTPIQMDKNRQDKLVLINAVTNTQPMVKVKRQQLQTLDIITSVRNVTCSVELVKVKFLRLLLFLLIKIQTTVFHLILKNCLTGRCLVLQMMIDLHKSILEETVTSQNALHAVLLSLSWFLLKRNVM
jgi:hypothetical protein